MVESSSLKLKFRYLQVHIPQSFDDEILKTMNGFPNSIFNKKDEVKSRKLVISFLSGNRGINEMIRKLDLIDRE